jgi:DUF4097 and DUF4098 domain-containing protein YvlB
MQRTFETPGHVLVLVENEVGLVELTAREGGETEVTLEAQSSAAEEMVERATVECRPSGGGHTIRVRIPHLHGMKFVRRNGVAVRITMPTGSDVEVATASADVEISGLVGKADLKTASGDVVADDATGDVGAKSASGDLSVGTVGGDLRLHSTSGDVRVNGVTGRALVSTTSGDIEVGSAGRGADVRSTSGDVRLGDLEGDASVVGVSGSVTVLSCASGRLQVRSVSGDIAVGVPRGVSLSVDAESLSGTVRSDIPLGDDPPSGHGAPDVVLTARSVSGDVMVERAVGALAL